MSRGAHILGACLALLAATAARAQDPNPLQMIGLHSGPANYTPGQAVNIQVEIQAAGSGSPTAMGLRETIPDGWAFAGMRAITGDLPAIAPQPGALGVLEFAWITIPPLPYRFVYTVTVPTTATDTAVISGQVEYRTNAGQQFSTPSLVTLNGPAGSGPKINLIGGSSINAPQGQPFNDPGYTATDSSGNDISSQVVPSGNVNTAVAGEYTITYTVQDSNGKTGSASRIVTVTANGQDSGGTTEGQVVDNSGLGNNSNYRGGPIGAPRNNQNANRSNAAQNRGQQNLQANNSLGKLGQNLPKTGAKTKPGLNLNMPIVPTHTPTLKSMPLAKGSVAKTGTAGAPAPTDDLKALDNELFGDKNTGEVATDASATPPKGTQLASAAGAPEMLKAIAPPHMPGLLERIKMRIAGLGKREIATIFASALVLAGLIGFAAVAGRIAYAGPVRRNPDKPAVAE